MSEWITVESPRSLHEALQLLDRAAGKARILAGGTDLLVQWHQTGVDSNTVIVINQIPELRTITEQSSRIRIGAAVTHWQIRQSSLIREKLPALAVAAAQVGSIQIQSTGTIGGNLANASPAADLAPPLLVAGAELVLQSATCERKVKLSDFFRGYRQTDILPGEMITAVLAEPLPTGGREFFRKLGPRAAQAIAKVSAAVRLVLANNLVTDIRIALGSVAPVPVRLFPVEDWLRGRELDRDTIAGVCDRVRAAIKPIDDIRSTANYRRWVAGNLVSGFLEVAAGHE